MPVPGLGPLCGSGPGGTSSRISKLGEGSQVYTPASESVLACPSPRERPDAHLFDKKRCEASHGLLSCWLRTHVKAPIDRHKKKMLDARGAGPLDNTGPHLCGKIHYESVIQKACSLMKGKPTCQ